MPINPVQPVLSRLDRFLAENPVLGTVRAAAGDAVVYLVGGAIRDALCGYPVDDIDLVVEDDPADLLRALDPTARVHPRFGTAELRVDGFPVDLARARTERYSHPGALPTVRFGSLEDDLRRRDFTINAIAVRLDRPPPARLIDPHQGLEDLGRGQLRLLHDRSFRDDPTRVIRGARYGARFGFSLARETEDLLDGVDLNTISADRLRSELLLAAGEKTALQAFDLLDRWGILAVPPPGRKLAAAALEVLDLPLWHRAADRAEVIVTALFEPPEPAIERLRERPPTPYQGVELAAGATPLELVLARAAGAVWLDEWRRDWRVAGLEITGADLIDAGIPEGPAVGAGIEAARRALLNQGAAGARTQLEIALAAAREF